MTAGDVGGAEYWLYHQYLCLPQLSERRSCLTVNSRSGRIGEEEELESGSKDTGQNVGQSCQRSVIRWEDTTTPNASCRKSATKITSRVELAI